MSVLLIIIIIIILALILASASFPVAIYCGSFTGGILCALALASAFYAGTLA